MSEIHLSLSESSIDAAIKQLEQYQQKLGSLTAAYVNEMLVEGETKIKNAIDVLDNRGTLGWAKDSISKSQVKVSGLSASGKVRVSDPKFLYVEFGTGVKGKGARYPGNFKASYSTKHGNKGWWYPAESGTHNPTLRETSNGGLIAWTAGQPSRPAVWMARNALSKESARIAREVFGNVD